MLEETIKEKEKSKNKKSTRKRKMVTNDGNNEEE